MFHAIINDCGAVALALSALGAIGDGPIGGPNAMGSVEATGISSAVCVESGGHEDVAKT